MDVLLIILAGVFMVVGLVGSIAPVLPGPPISYVALLMLHFTSGINYSTSFLLTWLAIVIVVTVLDNVLPLVTTRFFGGSKWAMWGSVVGLIVGFIVPPVGIIIGTLLGAIVGEMLSGKPLVSSLKAGFGAFVGFILTTGIKLICCGMLIYYYFRDVIDLIVNVNHLTV